MLTELSKEDFNKFDPIFRVIEQESAQRFAKLLLPNWSHPLVLCWYSASIEPVIVRDPVNSAMWVGVDQQVVCMSAEGRILCSIGLFTPLLQIKLFSAYTIVVCETELIGINRNFSLRFFTGYTEILDDVDVKDGKVEVTFIDGSTQIGLF